MELQHDIRSSGIKSKWNQRVEYAYHNQQILRQLQLNLVSEASAWVLQLLYTLQLAMLMVNMEMDTLTLLTLGPLWA